MKDYFDYEANKVLDDAQKISISMIETYTSARYNPISIFLAADLVKVAFKEQMRADIGDIVEKAENMPFDTFMNHFEIDLKSSFEKFLKQREELK